MNYIKSFDLFCAVETFTSNQFDFSTLFSDYIHFHVAGKKLSVRGRRSGGVAVLLKKKWADLVTQITCEIDNTVCLRLDKAIFSLDKDVLFLSIYIPPYGSSYYRQADTDCNIRCLEDFVLSRLNTGDDCYLMLAGDFNARISDWNGFTGSLHDDIVDEDANCHTERKSQDKTINQFGKVFIDFCTTFQCAPLNGCHSGDPHGQFTFMADQGNSVVDYIVVSTDLAQNANMFFTVGSRVESQHMPLHLYFLEMDHNEETEEQNQPEEVLTAFRWKQESAEEFRAAIRSQESVDSLMEAHELLETDPEAALQRFCEVVQKAGECMKRDVNFGKTTKRDTKRWYDKDCLLKKREARRALHKLQRNTSQETKSDYKQKRNEYKALMKDKRKLYRKETHQALLDNKQDSNKFWDTVRRARQKRSQHAKIDINTWQTHFEQVLGSAKPAGDENTESVESVETSQDREEIYIPLLDDPITESEVRGAIKNLKGGKAPGLDNICGEFLKNAEDLVVPFLTNLFNKIYETSTFPTDWCKSVIIPLFKKGDAEQPDNYRGISLMSIVSKVFTFVINKRLYSWAEQEEKISKEQAGFRKQYSTIDHVYTLVSIIKKKVFGRRGGKIYVAFVDYKKAFDSVDRDKLWERLEDLKTSTKMLNMLKSIYKVVKSCVRWGAKFSDFFECCCGVKQGCLLSPLVFSLLISEVADIVRQKGKHGVQLLPGFEEIFLLLFADDVVLMSSTPSGLQNQLTNLEKASKALGLSVNLNKSKIMIFRKGGHVAAHEKWFLDGEEIEIVNSYKYLGFTLTTKLSIASACEDFASRAKAKIVEIMKTMWALGCLDSTVFFQLFDAQVKPMLLYASELWGYTRLAVIESPHLFACKRLLSVTNRTPNHMVYGDTGRYPLYIDSMIKCVRYWLKVGQMPLTRFPRQALEMQLRDLELFGPDKNNWASNVKDILYLHGFQDVWTNGVQNGAAFLRSLKRKIIENFQEQWLLKLNTSERFLVYRIFKWEHKVEKYINDITIKKFRDCLIRFRFGINELRANRRFLVGTILKDCPFCPGTLENEEHFLLNCPVYSGIRTKYLGTLLQQVTTLKDILHDSQMDAARKVAMFVFYALNLREEQMNGID